MSSLRLMAILLLVLGAAAVRAAEPTVILYAYHLKPPFVLDPVAGQGLYFEFSAYANRKLGKTMFRTEYEPRLRLEVRLEQPDFRDAVIGVSPLWFKDADETRFLWSPTLLDDRDEVVSHVIAPIDYSGPESLAGKTVGLPLGYYYYGIDELAKAGRIRREDAVSEEQNLRKLLARRLDVTVVSRSTYLYLLRHQQLPARFHLSPRPHDTFARRILIAPNRPDVKEALDRVMTGMTQDPEWLAILDRYR